MIERPDDAVETVRGQYNRRVRDGAIAVWFENEERKQRRRHRWWVGILCTFGLIAGLACIGKAYSAEPETMTVLRGETIAEDGSRNGSIIMLNLTPKSCLFTMGVAAVYPLAADLVKALQPKGADLEAEEPWAEYLYLDNDGAQYLVVYRCEQVTL